MDRPAELEPILSADERVELASIAYLGDRLDAMLARGLISAEAHATVATESAARRAEIERSGRYVAALSAARTLAGPRPDDALAWVDRARAIDPGRDEAWGLAVDLLRKVGRRDEAIDLCAQGAERFPSLQVRLEELRRAGASPVEAITEARAALQDGDDARVVSLCASVLNVEPDHVDALVLLAFATQRLGRFDESLALYKKLVLLQPANTVWPKWVRTIQARQFATRRPELPEEPTAVSKRPPELSWSSVAGEFLEEHWQKLILGMAVLLIVVSSTVGAHMLLGPKLWSPVGKCTLALVYTVMFAGFGAGLLRWGAERAGRMMLGTTLILVPVNFMLAGEMRLLSEPSASRLIVLALDVAALFLVTRQVASALGWHRGATFLALGLVALSACDAATTHGVSFAWGFSAFLVPPWIFLGAVWWLDTRVWSDDDEEHREFVYLALGLLAFAFLSGLLRTAVVLDPPLNPTLFAVPVMLTAIACVLTAHHLTRFEKDPRRVLMMRFGGFVLSALALALALARPPGPSALYSGNTLATALLALALYATALRAYRQPAYLYFAFGALFLGYFGAFYFMVDLVRSVEEAARQALGYRQKLPFPFKAINGLAFNLVLGLLALHFSRRWKDDRLARHCHYLGVPFSIAACVLSMFETKAAVLCLSGYAVLYAAAVPIFGQPLLVYLACSSLAGALLFGARLAPGMTPAAQALWAVVLGLAYWGVAAAMAAKEVDRRYRIPLVHSGLTLALAAMVVAVVSVIPPGVPGSVAFATFALAALLCGLALADLPRAPLAHAAVAGILGACLCGFDLATGHALRTTGPFGIVAALVVLGVLGSCEWAGRRTSVRSAVFAAALPDAAQVLVVLAVALAALAVPSELRAAAATLALCAAGLLGTTRFRRERTLVYVGLALAVASTFALCPSLIGQVERGKVVAALAVTGALAGLALWGAGTTLRRRGGPEFYAVPCFKTALAVTVIVFVLAVDARAASRAAFPVSVAALVLNAVVYLLLTSAWRSAALTFASVGSLVAATYVTLFSVGDGDPEKAYILGLVAVVEALALWAVARLCHLAANLDHRRVYGRPLDVSALVLTVLALPVAHGSPVTMALATVVFLVMIKSFPSANWLYAAMGTLVLVLHDAAFLHFTTAQWMAAYLLLSFVLWALGIAARRAGPVVCRRIAVPDLAFEFPLFNAAIACGVYAAALRFELTLGGDAPWSAYAWVPLVQASFCLLMIKAYPTRLWVHAFGALASTGLAMAVDPMIDTLDAWPLAVMILALAFLGVGRALSRFEPVLCPWLRVEDVGAGAVLELWSVPHFLLAILPAAFGVVATTLDAIYFDRLAARLLGEPHWAVVAMTLALAWVYVLAQGGWIGEDRVVGLYTVQTLLVWWVGTSPWLVGHGVVPRAFLPLATSALALAVVGFGPRGDVGVHVSARRLSLAHRSAFLLALIAVAFTRGEEDLTTTGTLFLATTALGVMAVRWNRVESAYAGGLAWCALCGLVVSRLIGPRLLDAATPHGLSFAMGVMAGVHLLWWLTARLRRTGLDLKAWGAGGRDRVLLALERVSLAGALGAVAAVALNATDPAQTVNGPVGVAILLAAASFAALLASRWQSEWLVYAAQAALIGAYFDYRQAFRPSFATDAAVLTLFGYLDLGLAEVMQRLRMNLYARPTLYVSLALPLIPLVLAVSERRLDDLSLFLMLTTAAFYGVACYTRQWKSLGYAAAVILNAMLWLAWSRNGWKLADEPQFYLIPVGLSAILFAEVNRREFGNEAVNMIRGIGLSVIYLSLALPIWQFQSLGAWFTLLILSLAGIFLGIGLRAQSFLWLGLVGFVLDVVYQLGRMGAENALARWAIMLVLGILLFLFVALNEKKRIVATMRDYYDRARQWE